MAINEEIRTPGQGLVGTLSSNVLIEEANGRIIYRENGAIQRISTGDTDFFYDASDGRNYMQTGLLPDGSFGIAIAKEGEDIEDAFA